MLRPYRTFNPIDEFSKYELNNKLLGGKTFFRDVTQTQPYIF